MTQAEDDLEPRAPRRMALRRSFGVRLASLAFTLVCALAVHFTAAAHLDGLDALCLAAVASAVLGLSFMRYERRQPVFIELTPEGLAAFDGAGQALFRGRIVGAAQWAERLLVLAIDGAGSRRPRTFVVAADAVDPAAFRALAVRGRHAAH